MRKKFLAMVTALCCLSGIGNLTATCAWLDAWPEEEQAIMEQAWQCMLTEYQEKYAYNLPYTFEEFLAVSDEEFCENPEIPQEVKDNYMSLRKYEPYAPITFFEFKDDITIEAEKNSEEAYAEICDIMGIPHDLIDVYQNVGNQYPIELHVTWEEDALSPYSRNYFSSKLQIYIHYHPAVAIATYDTVVEEETPIITYRNAVVVGVDDAENPQEYVICMDFSGDWRYAYLKADDLAFLQEGSQMPAYGDILEVDGLYSIEEQTGTNNLTFDTAYEDGIAEEIRIVGSVFDESVSETFAVTASTGDATPYRAQCLLANNYTYFFDFTTEEDGGYTQPDGIDWTTVKSGDKVTFYTYEGVPMLPTAVAYAGDVNGDNAVTIADVIFLNRQILGDIDTARSTFNQELADYDANGIIDAADSLMILKRIVELI